MKALLVVIALIATAKWIKWKVSTLALNVIKQTSSNASEEKDYSESDSKSHQMNREEMLKITYELLQVLKCKQFLA